MAKELPYFKFEPNQWENGNIQLCSHEAQGVFINVCSMYWQRLGDLPYKLAVQKLCGGNATAIDSLCDEGIIKVIDGMICIDFLNEQLSEFENTSKTNSENARLGWQKRRKDAKPMRPHSDPNAIRGEKIREDKSKGDEIKTIALSKNQIFEELFTDEIWLEQISLTHKGKDIKQAWEECYSHHAQNPNAKNFQTWEWKQKLNTWLTIKKTENGKQNGLSKKDQHTASLVEAHAKRWGSDAPK